MGIEVGYYIEEDTDRAGLKIQGKRFWDILAIVKGQARNYGLRYDPDKRVWMGSFKNVVDFSVQHLQRYTMDSSALQQVQGAAEKEEPATEIAENGIKFDPKCLLAPTIEGIGPNKDFQSDCIKRGVAQNRLALYLEMGLGKTMIQISILNHLIKYKGLNRILIITPAETIYNWIHELKRFCLWNSEIDNEVSIGNKTNREPFSSGKKIVICTYRSFLLFCDDAKKKNPLKSKSDRVAILGPDITAWCGGSTKAAIVLDESHAMKNPGARQTKVILAHKDFFHYRFCLSGTPAPNGAHEMYAQMKFLDKHIVPNTYSQYRGQIMKLGNRFSAYAQVGWNYPAIKEYDEKFKAVAVRLKTAEAISLPSLVIENCYVPLPQKQAVIYQSVVDSILLKLKEDSGVINPREVQGRFPFLSLALDNPDLLKGKVLLETGNSKAQKILDSWKFEDHGKLDTLTELLNKYVKEENRKVIVFDYHPDTIDKLAEYYSDLGCVALHGQLCTKDTAKERDALLQKFRTDPNCNVLFASFLVLNTGVNLQEATRVIYFSRNYSLVNYLQSMKRAHRIGSKETVVVHPLIFEGSLNVYQDAILRRKKAFDENIFKLDKISDEQLYNIFSGANIKIDSATADELGVEDAGSPTDENEKQYTEKDYDAARQAVCAWKNV